MGEARGEEDECLEGFEFGEWEFGGRGDVDEFGGWVGFGDGVERDV